MSAPTPRQHARRLHERGFHVFPADHPAHAECRGKHGPESPCDGERGKHPAVKWGVWAVTVTPKMIDREWGKHGGLVNIAVSCGPSNLVVLDEDAPGEIERWCAAYGITLPDTYTVTTGRGRHLYFRWDHTTQRIGNSDKAMEGFKINVRGHGGYTIAEGSEHASGALYAGNEDPIADLPEQVAELLLAGGNREQVWRIADVDFNNAKIAFGDRHDALVAYAGRLRKSGLDEQEVEPTFKERWLLCEQPEGEIPEARYHSTACPYAVTWNQAKAKLHDVYQRYAAPGERSQDSGKPGEGTYTDSGNAAKLAKSCAEQQHYTPATGKWLRWDGVAWHKESDSGAADYKTRELADQIPIPEIPAELIDAVDAANRAAE